jgi:threonine/homoserine/homoserine lactone efflux protein
LNESEIIKENVDEGHGFLTGILLGFLNPNLFLSWMSTSLIIFSSLASFGFDTGGLDKNVSQQLIEIQHDIPSDTNTNHLLTEKNISKTATELHYSMPDSYPFLLCIFYALFAALGSMSWFYYLTWLIVKYRNKISESTIQRAVRILSVFLFVCGLFLGYKGINMLIDT